MKTIALIILLASNLLLISQTAPVCFKDPVKHVKAEPMDFKSCFGDVNNDGIEDLVMIDRISLPTLLVKVNLGNSSGDLLTTITSTIVTSSSYNILNLKVKDFNNDGNLDIIFIDNGLNKVSIFNGNGLGTFVFNNNYFTSSNVALLEVGDFNNDSHLDFATIANAPSKIDVFLNSGIGSFLTHSTYTITYGANSFKIADINNDNYDDLVYVSNGYAEVMVMNSNFSGTLSPPITYSITNQAFDLKILDLNGDSFLDVMTMNLYSIDVLIGSSTGSFISSATYSCGAIQANGYVEVQDFDNDGILDMATGGKVNYIPNVYIFKGIGGGLFNPTPIKYNIAGEIYKLKSGDFNHDGKYDLIMVSGADLVTVLINNGISMFTTSQSYYPKNRLTNWELLDFNGDGNLDFMTISSTYVNSLKSLVLGFSDGTFEARKGGLTYLGQIINVCVGDFNTDGNNDLIVVGLGLDKAALFLGDGVGNLVFSYTLSTNHGSTDLDGNFYAADFNSDGKTDLLLKWGGGFSIYLNSGVAGFSPPVIYSLGYPILLDPLISDINGDGKLDITLNDGINMKVFMGDGTGSFLSPILTGIGVSACCPTKLNGKGDFNGDGYSDIVTIERNMKIVSVFFESASGIPTSSVSYSSGLNPNISATDFLATNDLNGDGKLDILVTNNYSNNMYVLLGDGLGAFRDTTYLNVIPPFVSSFLVNDFNNDGLVDVLSKSSSSPIDIVIFLAGKGDGTFEGSQSFLFSNEASQIKLKDVDLNNDSKLDIVSYSGFTSFFISMNGTPPIISVSGTPTLCASSSGTLAATGGVSYLWSNGLNTSNIVVSPLISETYSVVGNNSYNCTNNAAFTITVSPSPSISVNSGTVCSGESFTMNPSGALSYTFSSGSSTVSPISTTTYTVSGSSIDGCIGTSSSSVTVNATTTITVNSGTICSGDSFTMNPSGALSYTFSSGSAIVSPTVNATYSVVGTSSLGCVGTNTAVSNVLVNSTPSITVLGTNSVCIGTSNSYTTTGALTYTWSTGATTPCVTFSPTVSTSYSVVGIDAFGCSSTEIINLIVDNTCQDVWPGDANSDGVADNLDVLELGLHFGQTGAARATTSDLWQSYFANNWIGTITSGKNLNHSDCNGNGVINSDDTLAIYNNYGLTHDFKPTGTLATDPQLSIIADQIFTNKGTWGTASIYLGDATTTINNVNGLAFTLNYDNHLIETDSVWIEYLSSFINVGNQNLHFRKRDFTNGKLYTATTHTINGNVSGNGKIAIVHFKINPTLTTDAPLTFGITQANSSSATGSISLLSSGTTSLLAVGATVGLKQYDGLNNLTIYPNPSNGFVMIDVATLKENMSVEIKNTLGQLVLQEKMNTKTLKLDISNISKGIYFIDLISNQRIIGHTKLIVD